MSVHSKSLEDHLSTSGANTGQPGQELGRKTLWVKYIYIYIYIYIYVCNPHLGLIIAPCLGLIIAPLYIYIYIYIYIYNRPLEGRPSGSKKGKTTHDMI